ncbi:MAG: ATP-binding protein, partial [Pseudomonadota bacterium]
SRLTGGTGLGLGIARAIARTHGATITLANRNEGGLVARVFFPADLAT